jgi:KaiC/GvpD/RAD55 family RecA-like ATPase
MKRAGRIWDDDPDLRAEAAGLHSVRRPNGHDTRRRIELVPFGKMQPNLKDADLVSGLLGSTQLSAIYGPPGCGKTFLALDIALRIATGRKFRGRRVTKGAVVYIAAEAGRRIFNRVTAWRMRRMREEDAGEVPFYAVPCQLNLCTTEDDLDELVAAIRETCDPVLIVVDTVSRVMAGGNENSPEDMGALVASADRLRDEFGANVCLVHHVGKDASRGARGHSLLHAAIDTEIEVTRSDDTHLSTAKIIKQRDGEIGEQIHFELEVVTIGENEDTGEEVTSCVVAVPDAGTVAEAERPRAKLSKAERIALRALEIVVERDGTPPPADASCPAKRWVREEAWRKRCCADGISGGEPRAQRIAFKRAFQELLADKLVGHQEPWVWLSESRGTKGTKGTNVPYVPP